MINLLHGDCLEQMKTLEDNSVDSIVSDPPYGISFMAKKWDYDVPSVEVWKEAMRVLKPGGHALIACGTRTQHRMVVNIEDAGFEIRDVVSWIYGSGFPKSLNISKAIDKAAGAERPDAIKGGHMGAAGRAHGLDTANAKSLEIEKSIPAVVGKGALMAGTPVTEAAKQWDGWGTALKPSCEFFTLCRKPLSESTIAKNVLKWGTGGINIDGCRVGTETVESGRKGRGECNSESLGKKLMGDDGGTNQGRFPANLIHDGSQEVMELFPETKSGGGDRRGSKSIFGGKGDSETSREFKSSKGSAARFFYCAKASKKDRDEGLEGFKDGQPVGGADKWTETDRRKGEGVTRKPSKNTHPTVKPTALMSYLCRLITPPNGVVLDPYMGSGSTGKAAIREGFSFVGIELDPDYYEIAKARVNHG
jgi:site-specific DNA-methyltransferase (adenine-specific)